MQGSKTGNFFKGVGAGMLAGATAVVVGKVMLDKKKHSVSKGSAKVVKAVSQMVDGVQTMFH